MITVNVQVDTKSARSRLEAMSIAFNGREIMSAIGLKLVQWIDMNFRTQGSERPWAPLKPNTVLKRTANSSAILQDRGMLKQSFFAPRPLKEITEFSVAVGSNVHYARYHEAGTRGPYTIRARNRKFLAFPVVFLSVRDEKDLKDKTSLKGDRYVLAKEVRHPGVPARPMLPSPLLALQIAQEQLENVVKYELSKQRIQGSGYIPNNV